MQGPPETEADAAEANDEPILRILLLEQPLIIEGPRTRFPDSAEVEDARAARVFPEFSVGARHTRGTYVQPADLLFFLLPQ